MLGAVLMANGSLSGLPGLRVRVQEAHAWFRRDRARGGWISLLPEGEGAVDPTASYLEFLALAHSAGLLDTLGLHDEMEALADNLVSCQQECGAWSFFPDSASPSIVSTALTVRALKSIETFSHLESSAKYAKASVNACEWISAHLLESSPSQIGYVLVSTEELLSSELRNDAIARLLRDMIIGTETVWEPTLERHKYFTVVRFGAPYCAAAVVNSPTTPEPVRLRLIGWLYRQSEEGFVRLPGGEDISTWPTRDFVIAMSSVHASGRIESLPTLLSMLENSLSLLGQANEAVRLYEATVPGISRRWSSRFQRQVRLLHIADLHLGHYQKSRTRPINYMDLVRDLRDNSLADVDYVVASGDLTSNTAPEKEMHPVEFELARDYLLSLLDELGLPVDRLVVVPGNHDIMWTPASLNSGHQAPTLNSINYRNFLRSIYGKEPLPNFFTFTHNVESRLIIAGLNSCTTEKDNESAWIGEVGTSQLLQLETELEGLGTGVAESCLKIATLHHHLVPVSYLEEVRSPSAPISLTVDAEAVVRTLLTSGFDLVLHGHQHQPFTALESRFYADEVGHEDGLRNNLVIHGTGSLGGPRDALGEISRNAYTVVTLVREGVDLHVRQAHPEKPGAYTTYFRRLIPRS